MARFLGCIYFFRIYFSNTRINRIILSLCCKTGGFHDIFAVLYLSMAISRKATLKYQGNQNTGNGQAVTYSLPPLEKSTNTVASALEKPSEISYMRNDLIKTVLIAIAISILELLVWWRLR